ncbi:MAG: 50S ribosomal protein L15 [Saprospirales bacterium]|nr:MAG: 50S ribosomal protein L15 [Saprospirales bacterium]
MELHKLKPAKGSNKKRKIVARGVGSGRGRSATRGTKGAQSRSGYKYRRNFEGGQTPLQIRVPKIGFNNPNRTEFYPINLDLLDHFCEKFGTDEISTELLVEKKVIKKYHKVKVLGRGELDRAVKIKVNAISEAAKKHIENKGGSVTLL